MNKNKLEHQRNFLLLGYLYQRIRLGSELLALPFSRVMKARMFKDKGLCMYVCTLH